MQRPSDTLHWLQNEIYHLKETHARLLSALETIVTHDIIIPPDLLHAILTLPRTHSPKINFVTQAANKVAAQLERLQQPLLPDPNTPA